MWGGRKVLRPYDWCVSCCGLVDSHPLHAGGMSYQRAKPNHQRGGVLGTHETPFGGVAYLTACIKVGGIGYRHFDEHSASLRVHLIPAYTHPIPDGMASIRSPHLLGTRETLETPRFCSDWDQFYGPKAIWDLPSHRTHRLTELFLSTNFTNDFSSTKNTR